MKKIILLFGMIALFNSQSRAQSDSTWIDLDGTNDYLDFGTDNLLAGQTQFTVEMKVHFNNSSGDYTVIGQRTADDNRTIVLQRWAGAFYLFLSNTNWGTCSFIPCSATLYHLAIVFDGTGATDSARIKLYINGTLQTLAFNGTIDDTSHITSPAANLVLGCEHNGPSTQLQYLDGQLGEFCVWNYPLTSNEINNRVIPEVTGTETGLVEYFRFDNGIPGGTNTGITSFAGGHSVSTITPRNMAMNGASSNFTGRPTLFNSVDTSLYVFSNTIYSNASGATFRWLDCNSGFAEVPGATSQSFTPASNGSYAVQVTQGACTDTSACVPITGVGIADLKIANIAVYPNPVSDEFVIENKENKEKLDFEILNSMGQVVLNGNLIDKTFVQTIDWAPGIYLIKLNSGKTFELKKILKR